MCVPLSAFLCCSREWRSLKFPALLQPLLLQNHAHSSRLLPSVPSLPMSANARHALFADPKFETARDELALMSTGPLLGFYESENTRKSAVAGIKSGIMTTLLASEQARNDLRGVLTGSRCGFQELLLVIGRRLERRRRFERRHRRTAGSGRNLFVRQRRAMLHSRHRCIRCLNCTIHW